MICTATDYIYYVQLNFYCQIILLKILTIFRNAHKPASCPHTQVTYLDHSCFSDLQAFRKYNIQHPQKSSNWIFEKLII